MIRTYKYIYSGGLIKITTPENMFLEAVALLEPSLENNFQGWFQYSNHH
jgi:hypothetical protein